MRVQLYGNPDQHRYDPLPVRAWHTFWGASWQIRAALCCAGSGLGLLITLLTRFLS